jgi:hypothetical protein
METGGVRRQETVAVAKIIVNFVKRRVPMK